MRHVLRNTGLLVSTLTLAATAASMSTADAAASQNPPKACASTEAYGGGRAVWAKATVCLTERNKPGLYGGQTLEPTDVLTGACSKAGDIVFWDKAPCTVRAKLTLRKDGLLAWTEERSLRSDPILGKSSGEAVDYYACRGRGEYSLTLHDATATVRYRLVANGTLGEFKTVQLPDVTVKAQGC